MDITYLGRRLPGDKLFEVYANYNNTHINIVLWRWLIGFESSRPQQVRRDDCTWCREQNALRRRGVQWDIRNPIT